MSDYKKLVEKYYYLYLKMKSTALTAFIARHRPLVSNKVSQPPCICNWTNIKYRIKRLKTIFMYRLLDAGAFARINRR